MQEMVKLDTAGYVVPVHPGKEHSFNITVVLSERRRPGAPVRFKLRFEHRLPYRLLRSQAFTVQLPV